MLLRPRSSPREMQSLDPKQAQYSSVVFETNQLTRGLVLCKTALSQPSRSWTAVSKLEVTAAATDNKIIGLMVATKSGLMREKYLSNSSS